MWASCRWNKRLARAVIALCTPSVSQMAYPSENVMWPGCDMLQLPVPDWKTFACMSTTTLLHTPSVLEDIWNNIVFPTPPTLRPPLLQFLRWLRCWLALTGCSSDFQKCQAPPSIVQETGPTRAEMAREIGLRFVYAFESLEPRWRTAAVRFRCSFLISSNGCIQWIPRKRRPSKPHHLTSPFPLLIPILLICSLSPCKWSPLTVITYFPHTDCQQYD